MQNLVDNGEDEAQITEEDPISLPILKTMTYNNKNILKSRLISFAFCIIQHIYQVLVIDDT